MKRRDFLLRAGQAVTLPFVLNGLDVLAIGRSRLLSFAGESDRVLVLIQLNGGNDGLNMCIPLDYYDQLYRARPNILMPKNQLLPATETLALHPSLGGVRELFDAGRVEIVQSVGYPNQNRSHFRSSDIWTSGSPAEETWPTGWLGRHFQSQHPAFPEDYPNPLNPDPIAVTVGRLVSETCQGATANFSLTLDDPFGLSPLKESPGDATGDTPYDRELAFLRTTIFQTNR